MQNMWTNYFAKHSWDCERLKNVGKEMVKHNFGHSFNNFYLVFKERNYLVPYKFSFRQIIWIQVTPTDRFKIFWKNLIEKTFLVDSWQINKKSCKIVFHNIPDRFMTKHSWYIWERFKNFWAKSSWKTFLMDLGQIQQILGNIQQNNPDKETTGECCQWQKLDYCHPYVWPE